MIRSTDYLRRIIVSARVRRRYDVILVSVLWQFPVGRLRLVCLWWKGRNNSWCVICGEKYDWRQPNRLLVVETGASVNQVKVFRAHAVPQDLCWNLINTLKLLANQQEDGDVLIQNIVTNFCEGSREGLTNGMWELMKIDYHRVLQEGHLNEDFGIFKVRRSKGSEGSPETTVRESPDELTLRAEEVDTWKSYMNVVHTKKERWGPSLVDNDWYVFCQTLYKGIEGKESGQLCDAYEEMSRTGEAKKPQEAQKANVLWKMKAAKDAGEKYYDPTHADNILERNKTRLALWEEHLKDTNVALDKALKCVGNSCWKVLVRVLRGGTFCMTGVDFLQTLWQKPVWESVRWIVSVDALRPWSGMRQGMTVRMTSPFPFW